MTWWCKAITLSCDLGSIFPYIVVQLEVITMAKEISQRQKSPLSTLGCSHSASSGAPWIPAIREFTRGRWERRQCTRPASWHRQSGLELHRHPHSFPRIGCCGSGWDSPGWQKFEHYCPILNNFTLHRRNLAWLPPCSVSMYLGTGNLVSSTCTEGMTEGSRLKWPNLLCISNRRLKQLLEVCILWLVLVARCSPLSYRLPVEDQDLDNRWVDYVHQNYGINLE